MLDEKHFQKKLLPVILHQLFTDIDDFCNYCLPAQNSERLPSDIKNVTVQNAYVKVKS
ncbi:MAG: hypothetical protein RL236_1776 [Pseudomonadota bacterium]